MVSQNKSDVLREIVRILERKLGVLDDLQSSCCGVTFAQCHAIVEIGRARKISLNDLADILGLDKSTMSRTINNLVENDLAARELDPEDRRYITIQLTAQGMQSFQEIETGMGAYFIQIYQSIPEAKRDQVIDSLHLLVRALAENDCCKKC
jgi:DNA-binding MarR family transcriptional regulator